MGISYRQGGMELLDDIAPLWGALNRHLSETAVHFQEHYRSMDFERRRRELIQKSRDGILVIIASEGDDIGYCVSTLHGNVGWVDSIYIDEGHRGNGIGAELMRRSMDWLSEMGALKIMLTVTPGNDDVIEFYQKLGFHPRKLVMELDADH